MDVVRQVVKAAQDHIDSERASHTGNMSPDLVITWSYTGNIVQLSPLIDNYLSHDDCLEDKREDYQNCFVLCCVSQLYPIICILLCKNSTSECFLTGGLGLLV